MGRSRRNVGGYRGRRTSGDVLRTIALVLAVVVVLVLGGLFLGQRYLVYTDDGLRLALPFFDSSEPSQTLPDPGSVSLVERPAAKPDESRSPEELPVEEPEYLTALELPLEAVLQGTARARLEEAGADALVLEMKTVQGLLGWKSAHPLAAQAEVNGTQDAADAVRAWNEGDVYTVARVCCFRDNAVPYHRNALALRATYGNWRDELGLRWMDPANEDVWSYLAVLCGELAALGFDEIVLEQASFPVLGNRDTLTADNAGREAQQIERFLERVNEAVEPYDTVLSLRIDEAVLNGEAPWCGLEPNLVEACAGRIWVAEDAAVDRLGLESSDEPDRVVRLVSALDEEGNGHRALLTNP